MKLTSILPRIRAFALAASAALALASAALVNLGPAPALVAGAAIAVASTPAEAALSMATATRNDRCTALVTTAGTGSIMQVRSGARPANANTAASGTLLATLTWTGVNVGSCTSGVLDINEAGATQTAASHTSGTPGHIRWLKSDGTTVVLDIDVCGSAPCWTFTGTVATGQNVTLTTMSLTEGNT